MLPLINITMTTPTSNLQFAGEVGAVAVHAWRVVVNKYLLLVGLAFELVLARLELCLRECVGSMQLPCPRPLIGIHLASILAIQNCEAT